MLRTKKIFFCSIILVITILSSAVLGAGIKEKIEVYRNQYKVEINNSKTNLSTFTYNNKTYVPLEDFTKLLGISLTRKSGSIGLFTGKDNIMTVQYPDLVDSVDCRINAAKIGISSDRIDTYKLEKAGDQIPASFAMSGDDISMKPVGPLDNNTEYLLKVYMKDGKRLDVLLKTDGLPKLELVYSRKVVFVPAMPDKGFNYPYYLVLPKKTSVDKWKGKKNYLFVETHNTGRANNDLNFHIDEALSVAKSNSAIIAEDLGLPRIVPIIVRPFSKLNGEYVYTHSLTRNTVYLEKLKKAAGVYDKVFEPMNRVDVQVVNMIKHANGYLKANGWKMEDRIFMWGFSASGDFTNRFTFLHPEMVKAACFGGFPIAPVKKVGKYNMIFPLGSYDYKEITGHELDLKSYNNAAKLGFIGSEDHNNPRLNDDQYTDVEKTVIESVLAVTEYPDRWKKQKTIFAGSGAEGQASVYIGAGHETFYKGMHQDYLNFFMANRDSDRPVYVQPSEPESTLTDIYSNNIVKIEKIEFNFNKTTITEAFWSGSIPDTLPNDLITHYQKIYPYQHNLFLIRIAEWDLSSDYNQMSIRLEKVTDTMTLRAEGYKDVRFKLSGSSSSGFGEVILYNAYLLNEPDMVSGVKYRIVDETGSWIPVDGVYVMRPKTAD